MNKLIIALSLASLTGCNQYISQEERLQIRAGMARLQADQLYREQIKHYRGARHK